MSTQLGSETNPLRVAVIGSGPAAFYAADHLLKQSSPIVQIDMFDRLPTPYGLVRGGVAPDHQKIKSVTRVFEQIAIHPRFRFFGNVEFGKHLCLEHLKQHYHQILYATGAQADRHMNIPGEELRGSHAATEFVAWYNGHPDFRECHFDLSQERVAVIGIGNVAIDVARILCLAPNELARTDIADYALEALIQSRVKEVFLLGRRGPAQAAFTNPEIKELGGLDAADALVLPADAQLDELSRAELEKDADPTIQKKVELVQELAARRPSGKPRQLHIRFLVSPVELIGNQDQQIISMRLAKNLLYRTEAGSIAAKATDEIEEFPVGLAFRSVGYLGIRLPGVPFDDRNGVITNEKGRVIDPVSRQPLVGQYVTGWIKRGPSGVIGTNKPDSVETTNLMLADLANGSTLAPSAIDSFNIEEFVRARQPNLFTFADWQQLDRIEVARGQALGRPRVKFTSVNEMLSALGRALLPEMSGSKD
jgi:ferredoxin/flavodoxin---NADP+ reductase